LSDIKITETLFQLIPFIESKFMRPVDQHYAGEMTPVQIRVLLYIKEKSSLTMTTLANEMMMSKQQLTPLVKDLVLKKLVQREHDPNDGRVIRISLTPLGLKWHDTLTAYTLNMLKAKLDNLDETDLNCLYNALTDLYNVLQKI